MDEGRQRLLLDAGVNLETAMNRFMGNEDLLVQFLKRFPDDPNYGLLVKTMGEKDYEGAFQAAHAMKGLIGNLSLDSLSEVVCREVEFLRHGEYSDAEEHFPEVVTEYERVAALLGTL